MPSHSVFARSSRSLDIESLAAFDRALVRKDTALRGWHVQGVDLTGRSAELRRVNPEGALFLGCTLTRDDEHFLRAHGALLFPAVPDVPFDAYRGGLYRPQELYQGLDEGYEQTPDALIYAWSRRPGTSQHLEVTLATSLHDHAISDAFDDAVDHGPFAGKKIVGVMGGHALERGDPAYREAAVLGRSLAGGGFSVATGGGPGAMEAGNLGAYLADIPEEEFEAVLSKLARVPSFRPSITEWAQEADAVREAYPKGRANIGIPTWFYGHEPPNLFATHIAKYFTNSIREAVLLERSAGGVVFLPGAAGTVQEIFQDACENYYAAEESIAPMILVGRRHWEETVPAWPLLQSLARDRDFGRMVHLVDTVQEAAEILLAGRRQNSRPVSSR